MRKIEFDNIEIENFRSHESIGFNYKPNRFCVITGRNGKGKTTLVADSLCWALYDETSKGRKGDAVIRKRSGKNTYVKLVFSIDGIPYTIENYRKHHEFHDEKFLKRDGRDISGSKRAITNQKIEQLFMPKDVFLNCILFSQYITKSFTELTDKGQKVIFDKMMGFGKYDDYCATTKAEIKTCNDGVRDIDNKTVLIDNSMCKYERDLEQEKESYKNLTEDYRQQFDGIKYAAKTLTEQNKKLEKIILNSDDLDDNREALASELTTIKNKKDKLVELFNKDIDIVDDKYKHEFDKVKHDLELIHKDNITKLITDKNLAENEYNMARTTIDSKNEEIKSEHLRRCKEIEDPYNSTSSEIMETISSAKGELSTHENELENIQDSKLDKSREAATIRAKLDEPVPKCYACDQDLKKGLRKIKKKLSELTGELVDLAKRETSISGSCHVLRMSIQSTEKDRVDLKSQFDENIERLNTWKKSEQSVLKIRWSKEKAKLEKRKASVEPKITATNENLNMKLKEETSKSKQKCEEGKSIISKSHENSIAELRQKYIMVDAKLKNADETLKSIQEAKNTINSNVATINSKREEYNNIVTTSKKVLGSIEEKLHSIKTYIKEETEKRDALSRNNEKLKRRGKILNFWNKGFSSKGIRAILLDESIPILNEYALEISRNTDNIRVRFDSTRELKSGETRNEFSVRPIQTQNLTDDREDFSQGEGRMVDIITLLSLRHLLEKTYDVKFNISLFDEILDSLDAFNSETVLDFLRKMSQDTCTILITHTLKNNTDYDELLEL